MKALGRAVETDLGELAHIAWEHRRLLAAAPLLAALIALGVSFLLTPRYHSVASVLPAKGFLREQLIVFGRGELVDAVQLRPATASNSQNLVTAASFRLRQEIVAQLGLIDFFGHGRLAEEHPDLAEQRTMEDLRRASHFELSIYRDVLFIHVSTRDPEMSAAIANLYVELIEAENLLLYRERAKLLETYLEKQLARLQAEILAVSDSLAAFYAGAGLVEVGRERDNLFSLLETLQHQRSALQLTLAREALDRAPSDPHLRQLSEQLALYDELLAEYAPGGKPDGERSTAALLDPGLLLRAKERERRLDVLQEQESGLRAELSAAVMEGNREEARLPVMDRAFPASEPYWPRRWLMTIAAAVLAFGLVYLVLVYRRALRTLAPAGGL